VANEEQYDLFVSYAHRDNSDGWVEAFVAEIQKEHLHFSPKSLRIFLDLEGIRTMDDWEHRILGALRSSRLMLAMLTPHFFESAYCRKEWEIYVEHELDKAMVGESIAPVYVATASGYEDEANAALDAWLSNMRRRQYVDVRPWRQGGREALQAEDARHRLQLLEQRLSEGLEKAGRIAASPTTIPPHNAHFVGRLEELRKLREFLALGRVGAITAVHGLGGMGKSALAFEYAHAYADDYPGGRYLVPCAQVDDVRIPLVNLAEFKDVALTDADRKDLAIAFARVRAAFETGPRSLLVLDNVDNPKTLSPSARAQFLPSSDNVHILVTTRLESDRLSGLTCLALDTLSEEDALLLLKKYRPFLDDAERHAARSIVRRLEGYALAVEVVGVYLWKTADEGVTYVGYLQRLESEGFASLDDIAVDDRVDLSRHQQSTVSKLLEPTLAKLSPPEKLALEFAALLPSDSVPLTWLKELVVQRFPEYGAHSKPGYPDLWRQVTRRLLGLRLLVQGESDVLARIHGLTQHALTAQLTEAQRSERSQLLVEHAKTRARSVASEWTELVKRWEIKPLQNYALLLLDQGNRDGCILANIVSNSMRDLGNFVEARELLRRSIAVGQTALTPENLALVISMLTLGAVEQDLGNRSEARELLERTQAIVRKTLIPDHPAMVQCYCDLGRQEIERGNPAEARKFFQRALAIDKKFRPPDDLALAHHYSNIAIAESDLGNLGEARELLRLAIAIQQKTFPPDHPTMATIYSNLASVERQLGNTTEARDLLKLAITIDERHLPVDHPVLAARYSNLALVEEGVGGNLQEARELLQRAIAIEQKAFAPDHPNLAKRYSNIAGVEFLLGNLPEAREWLRRAIAIAEKISLFSLGTDCASLGLVEHALGNFAGARELLQKAIAIQQQAVAPNLPELADMYVSLGTMEWETGNMAKARELLRTAIAIQRSVLAADHPDLAYSYSRLAAAERDLGNLTEARALLVHAIAIQEKALPSHHPTLADSYSNLAIVEQRLRNLGGARRLMQNAYTIWASTMAPIQKLADRWRTFRKPW
jgi:tetratricopeptide (TPR) repeat protein